MYPFSCYQQVFWVYLFVVDVPRDELLVHIFKTASVLFQALNEIAESEGDPEYEDDEMAGGSLLR